MTLQQRLNTFESEARGRLRRALSTGNEKLLEIDEALARVARDGLTVPPVRRRLDELRARAESLRTAALKRVGDIPGEAVTKLANGTRAPIQNLASGLARIAKRIEPLQPAVAEAPAPAGETPAQAAEKPGAAAAPAGPSDVAVS
jgi:hypothetical protein